jgi:DnaJ-class molecular chaperone
MEDGDQIVIGGVGDEAPGLAPGDLVVELRLRPHDRFTRRGDDLLAVKRIGLAQALLGGAIPFRHLDGRLLLLGNAPGQIIAPGAIKVVDGEGMPMRGSPRRRGNLFVRFSVAFPDAAKLTPALRDAFLRAIPPVDEASGFDPEAENVFFVTMADSNLDEFVNARSSREERQEAYHDGRDEAGDTSGETCHAV